MVFYSLSRRHRIALSLLRNILYINYCMYTTTLHYTTLHYCILILGQTNPDKTDSRCWHRSNTAMNINPATSVIQPICMLKTGNYRD